VPATRDMITVREGLRGMLHPRLSDLAAPPLRSELGKLYARVATDPCSGLHFHRSLFYAAMMRCNNRDELASLPSGAVWKGALT
jgi:hypothetical protein